MSSTDADLVFLGATVETMVSGSEPADAVVVRDGRIVHVGSSSGARQHIGPRTRVIELDGETLLPGFQDAHIHPIEGGMLAGACDLHGLADASAYLEAISSFAAAHPDVAWVTGEGWALTAFPRGEPERGPLDAAVSDRPAFFYSHDGHVGWASSRALAIAGIDRATPEPPDGRIVRDGAGDPTGTLVDGAIDLLAPHLPAPSHADRLDGLRAAQRLLHALGITAWQDAHVEPDALLAYREAAGAGWLTARVVAALWWERDRGVAEQIEAFEQLRADAAMSRLRADSVKLMLDGILESQTALMTAPYAGSEHGGTPFIDPEVLREAVIELDRRGFQAHFHAIGDGAVRLALDTVEAAREVNGPSDGRHHIAHIEVVHPDDVPRFGRLGVAANMQPFWAADDEQMQTLRNPLLGPGRIGWQYPFGSLLRTGATLAGGSDWTVTTANPLLEVEVAVHRVAPDARESAPFLPDERIGLDDALRAFTVGSAFVNHLDAETGTVEVGKLADLVVLDRNVRAADAGPIGDASVRLTIVEGDEVFSASGVER